MKKERTTFKNQVIVTLLAIALLGTYGCRNNDPISPSSKTNFEDLKINPDFKFSTTKELEVNLEVISNNPQEPPHRFSIYNGDPDQSGKLIISGISDPYSKFQTTVIIPSFITELYITNQNINNEIEKVVVDATGIDINYSFETGVNKAAGFKSVNAIYPDPGCTNPANATTLTGTYSTLNVNNNNTYRVPATETVTITNKADFKGGTLIVCGTLIIDKITSNSSGGDFVITASGIVELDNGNIDKDLTNFINHGTITVGGQTTIKDFNFENHGTFTVDVPGNGSDGLNSDTEDFYNYGTMTIEGAFNNNDIGFNYGTLTISDHYNTNGNNREFTNECKMIIGANFNANGTFTNEDGAYVSVGQNTTFGGNSTIYMGAQSLIETDDLSVNDEIIGPSASRARFNVTNSLSFGGSSDVSGYVDFCDDTPGGSGDNNNGTWGPNVQYDCTFSIPTTGCNPGATPPITDTDNDGCPDDQDDYPTDPLRCSNDYYPNQTEFTSIAFEDLWTGYGDYDFNDLVMQTNYKIVKNYSDEVVEVYAQFHIAAVGAGLNNGFGVEFDLPASEVISVNGIVQTPGLTSVSYEPSGIESGQTNAVVIVYNAINAHLGASMVNTEAAGTTMDIDTITVHILFDGAQSTIGTPPYNPFIFVGQDRGREIHKIDNTPTDLANVAYFGQQHDDSDPAIGRYYVSASNLPWAIEIPADYEWPYEKTDILTAYLKFANWAETSGSQDADWYSGTGSAYRDQSKIYQTPTK